MKASEFVQSFASKGLATWESQALDAIRRGDAPDRLMRDVFVQTRDGKHQGVFSAASDYLSIGEPSDAMRMPLTPMSAQKIADVYGMLLPTSKMVDAIWTSAGVKLEPRPMIPNRYVNLGQFLEHSKIVDEQLHVWDISEHPLIVGHKKDVVVSRVLPPGKVVIYGWHRPDGTHIQPKTSVHSANYLDYSHGIRLIGPWMQVDGQPMKVTDVLRDRALSGLLSDEGPIEHPRYGSTLPRSSLALTLEQGEQMVEAWGREFFSGRRTA